MTDRLASFERGCEPILHTSLESLKSIVLVNQTLVTTLHLLNSMSRTICQIVNRLCTLFYVSPHPYISTGKVVALCPFFREISHVHCPFAMTAEPMSKELLEGLCPNILLTLFLAESIDLF